MGQDIKADKIDLPMVAVHTICAGIVLYGLYESALGWLQLCRLLPSRHILFPATGTFYNPGPYCGFLATIIPLATAFVLDKRPKPLLLLSAVYLAITLPLMPSLMGRTGWIAAFAGGFFVLAVTRKIHIPGKFIPAIAILAAAAAVLLVYMKPASALGRLFLWIVGIKAVGGNLLTGSGWDKVAGQIGTAQEAYFEAHPGSIFANVAGSPEYPFNEFINIAIAYGIPAMSLFIAVMVFCCFGSFRAKAYGLCGSIISFGIVCMSSYPLQFIECWVIFTLLLIASLVASKELRPWIRIFLATGVLIVLTCHCVILTKANTSDRKWNQLRYAYQYSLTKSEIEHLDSLRNELGDSPKFLFDYGRALRLSKEYAKSNEVLSAGMEHSSDPMFLILLGRNHQDLGRYDDAVIWYNRAINRNPSRFYPYYLLAKLYASPEYFNPEGFCRTSEIILQTNPKIDSPAVRQIKAEVSQLRDSIQKLPGMTLQTPSINQL